jgi:hypothetical protein
MALGVRAWRERNSHPSNHVVSAVHARKNTVPVAACTPYATQRFSPSSFKLRSPMRYTRWGVGGVWIEELPWRSSAPHCLTEISFPT